MDKQQLDALLTHGPGGLKSAGPTPMTPNVKRVVGRPTPKRATAHMGAGSPTRLLRVGGRGGLKRSTPTDESE
jgi:hypothetical protein